MKIIAVLCIMFWLKKIVLYEMIDILSSFNWKTWNFDNTEIEEILSTIKVVKTYFWQFGAVEK